MLDLTSRYIFEIYYQVHMYVDSREKVTARYQVIPVMNYHFNNLGLSCSFILVNKSGFALPCTFSWLAHRKGKSWSLEALSKQALFYLKLLKDGVGELLCYLMSLLIFSKMGP